MKDLELRRIGYFSGTEQYHRLPFFETVATDGVIYLVDNGYSWFVTDAVAVAEAKFKDMPFLHITLKLLGDDKGQMVITDGDKNILYSQKYGYTDAKRELSFYIVDRVALLPSEY